MKSKQNSKRVVNLENDAKNYGRKFEASLKIVENFQKMKIKSKNNLKEPWFSKNM